MISIAGLTKRFDAAPVLDGVTLDLAPGERAALIGHNGSGKTTLMRCLLGLYEHAGEVRIGGRSPRRERETVLADVAFVPQAPPALRMTVGEFIATTAGLTGCAAGDVAARAADLGLEVQSLRRKPFAQLSGGMKQKLLIGAAIARQPKVLLMDEPAASLDPLARGRFFALLAGMPAETVMVLSSHRVDELAGIVTRLVELDAGRLVLDDAVAAASHGVLGGTYACTVRLRGNEASVGAGLREWGFTQGPDGAWQGSVAGPDRFRFLAALARWSGAVEHLHMEKAP